MAEITRKRTGEFLRKLFEILIKHPEGLQAGVALEQLASVVTLSEYEAGNYESSGTRRFDKIVRFATVDCAKAGWLLKQKGIWTITESGIQAYNAYTDPEAFYREAVRLYHVWRATQPGKVVEAPEATTELEPDHAESATITYEQAEEQAWTEIEKHLHGMNPYEFQKLVADLLQAMGYYVSWVSPPGKDGGVDIIAFTDALGTKLPRIKVQVKRVGQRIDKDGLKSFFAIIGEHDVGLYVSTGGFTRDAEEFARSQERRQITLIDLDSFVELWIKHLAQLEEPARQRLPLTPIYFLTPES
jgi:restriction system protein